MGYEEEERRKKVEARARVFGETAGMLATVMAPGELVEVDVPLSSLVLPGQNTNVCRIVFFRAAARLSVHQK